MRDIMKPWKSNHERSKDYDTTRKGYSQKVIDELLKGVSNIDLMLDLGSGTGQIPDSFMGIAKNIIATDPEANRVEEERRRFEGTNVEFKNEGAENISLKESSVDFVTAAQCFQYFEKEKSLAEIYRVLKQGGKFSIIFKYVSQDTDWAKMAMDTILDVERDFKTEIEKPRCMVSQVSNSPFSEMLEKAGFDNISFVRFQDEYAYSVEDWASLITWSIGAGAGKLDKDFQTEIEKRLIRKIKDKNIESLNEVYEHFIFSGFKTYLK